MTQGTPGFVGSRLREAREALGMNGVALADLLGLSRQAVSQYERDNGTTPSPEMMDSICHKLGLLPHFFLRKPLRGDSTPVFYRSMASATKTARIRAERRFSWLKEIVLFLQQYIKPITVKLPEFDVPEDPKELCGNDIERFATATRRFWGLGDGPISNVVWLLENNGIIVTRHELAADKLDAFSQWADTTEAPMIVLGADKGSAVRSRFDAAHELGHLILHRGVTQKALNKNADFEVIEDQAHRFAGAFLLPEATFLSDLIVPQLDAMQALKPKWKVAIALMVRRLEDLGIISEEQARRLWINRTRRGWRINEPLDADLAPEYPRFLQRAFAVLLENQIIAADDVECSLGIPLGIVEKLCCLPSAFFTDDHDPGPTPDILPLRPFTRDALA